MLVPVEAILFCAGKLVEIPNCSMIYSYSSSTLVCTNPRCSILIPESESIPESLIFCWNRNRNQENQKVLESQLEPEAENFLLGMRNFNRNQGFGAGIGMESVDFLLESEPKPDF